MCRLELTKLLLLPLQEELNFWNNPACRSRPGSCWQRICHSRGLGLEGAFGGLSQTGGPRSRASVQGPCPFPEPGGATVTPEAKGKAVPLFKIAVGRSLLLFGINFHFSEYCIKILLLLITECLRPFKCCAWDSKLDTVACFLDIL